MIVETERLLLRPMHAWYCDVLIELFSQPEIMRYLPTGQPRTPDATLREMDAMLEHWRKHGFGVWVVQLRDRPDILGYCGLQWLHAEPEGVTAEALANGSDVEIEYGVAQQWWGQGIVREAARAALRFGMEDLGLERVVAAIHPDNVASRRILEGLGLRETEEIAYYGLTPHFILRREQYQRPVGYYHLYRD